MGWSQIFTMYFMFAVNFIVIFWFLFGKLKLLAVKYYRRIKFWVETKVEENQGKIDYWLSKLTQSKNAVIVVEEEEEAKVEEQNEY